MKRKLSFQWLTGVLLVALLFGSVPAVGYADHGGVCENLPPQTDPEDSTTINVTHPTNGREGHYQINFLGSPDGGLTWCYSVQELADSTLSLSHWAIGLCMANYTLVEIEPDAGEHNVTGVNFTDSTTPPADVDPTTSIDDGIKWDLDESFSSGVFWFKFSQPFQEGIVEMNVAAKSGPEFNTGTVTGPIDATCANAVDLVLFRAAATGGGTTISWQTATEIDNAGFNLYRAEAIEGPYTILNDSLIPAKGGPAIEASYEFTDAAGPGTYYYKLEDVETTGISTLHGPVSVQSSVQGATFLHSIFLPALQSN